VSIHILFRIRVYRRNETHSHVAKQATLHASVKLWGEYAKDA